MVPGDTLDIASINTLDSIAILCPYMGGDAVYYARALLAQYADTLFFDDVQLCPIDSSDTTSHDEERAKRANNGTQTDTTSRPITSTNLGIEFAKVYPNPAKQIINLVFSSNTTGSVEFDLIDQLGETVMRELLGSQTFTQFSTGSLSNGLYYWVLKDGGRIIKTGKVAIIK